LDFRKRPVDPFSILPALAVSPLRALAVDEPLRLALGVIDENGRYHPLAWRSLTLPDALAEEDATRESTRQKYRPEADETPRRRKYFELVYE
jgi:hypothetical protein